MIKLRVILALVFLSGCGGAGLRSGAKDGAADRPGAADVVSVAASDAGDLVASQAVDLSPDHGLYDATPAPDVDVSWGTDAGDAASEPEGGAVCPPSSTLCCGMCLPPNAGICAPCESSTQDAAFDTGASDGAADETGVSCGDATCPADHYCLTVSGGPAPRCLARLDGGVCPPGTQEGCGSVPGSDGGCLEINTSTSCQSLPISCTSGDPCTCLCGVPGSGSGCNATGRIVYCGRP